jgi:hypothetical protein
VSLQHCVGAKASLTRRSRDVEEPRRSHVLALESALLVGLQPPVKQCYSTLLEQDPTAEGAFSIRMKIRRGRDGKGELADARFESPRSGLKELNAPLFQQCVLGALAKLELPAPRDGREEEEQVVPFNFGGLSGDDRYRRQNPP